MKRFSLISFLTAACIIATVLLWPQSQPSSPAKTDHREQQRNAPVFHSNPSYKPSLQTSAFSSIGKVSRPTQGASLLRSSPLHLVSAIFHEMNADEQAATLRECFTALQTAHSPQDKSAIATILVATDHADSLQTLSDAYHREANSDAREAIVAALSAYVGNNQEAHELLTSTIAIATDASFVAAASQAIARSASDDTMSYIQELIADPRTTLQGREQLLQAVRSLDSRQAHAGLTAMLQQQDAEVRQAAAVGLARQGTQAALDSLMHAAAESNDLVRLEPVLDALHQVRDPELKEPLAHAAQSTTDPLLRVTLEAVLANVSESR